MRKDQFTQMANSNTRHTVWLSPEAWDRVESHYRTDNCSTKNEYIEKAIRFYSGYLETGSDADYIPRVLAELLEGKLNAFGKRIGAQLFKLAVNDAMLTYLTAYTIDVDQASLDKLRTRSVLDTKQTRGVIDFDEARSALRED